jgi:hypothetical protein
MDARLPAKIEIALVSLDSSSARLSGDFSGEPAKAMGQLLGAGAIVTGSLPLCWKA